MTNFHRTNVAVPYRASVVPKGGRVAKPQVFRVDVAVEIELLDKAPPVAVRSKCNYGSTATYLGHAGSLWQNILSDWQWSSPALPAETVLEHFRRGNDFGAMNGRSNPFDAIGRHQRLGLSHSVFTGRIEDAALRSIHWEESVQASAAAQRVARDLLLTEDGQIFRRSRGPVWHSFTKNGLDLLRLDFEVDAVARNTFCCTRLDEAVDWFGRLHGFRPNLGNRQIDIILPEHVENRDAEETARGVLSRNLAEWVRLVEPLASPSVAALAKDAMRGFEHLHGIDFDLLKHSAVRDLHRPVEALHPEPEEILAAVEAFRLFVAEMPGDIRDREAKAICHNWRKVFEDLSGLFLRRFDEFEAPRIDVVPNLPDFDSVPSSSPAL